MGLTIHESYEDAETSPHQMDPNMHLDSNDNEIPQKKKKKKSKKGKTKRKKKSHAFQQSGVMMSIEDQGLASMFISDDPQPQRKKKVAWYKKKYVANQKRNENQ